MGVEGSRSVLPGGVLRVFYRPPDTWRPIARSRSNELKQGGSPFSGERKTDTDEDAVRRRLLVLPDGVEEPAALGKFISLVPNLARAVCAVLTESQYVVRDGYYKMSIEPRTTSVERAGEWKKEEVGQQVVLTRLPDQELLEKVEPSVRALLDGAEVEGIVTNMPKMWANLPFLIKLLPEKVYGPTYYYCGKMPADSDRYRPGDLEVDGEPSFAARFLVRDYDRPEAWLKLLEPTWAQINGLFSEMFRILAQRPDAAAAPVEINLDGPSELIRLSVDK